MGETSHLSLLELVVLQLIASLLPSFQLKKALLAFAFLHPFMDCRDKPGNDTDMEGVTLHALLARSDFAELLEGRQG